jgi:phosphoribosylformylglycinamidine (FGAM) synthase-like amidotransferase family enzyme
MAALHVIADTTKPVVRDLHRYLKMMKEAGEGIRASLDAMSQLSDGSRDSAADFDLLATVGGYAAGDYADANAAAKKSFDELSSVVGNYETATKSAVDQAIAIHGLT